MRLSTSCLPPLLVVALTLALASTTSAIDPLPIKEVDFGEPDWEVIIKAAFPTWEAPENGCPRLDKVGGKLVKGYEEFPTPEDGSFNPCYYTKAFAGQDPSKGGYPTPIDTHYPYENAAPFFKQPGDGSVHHCPVNAKPDTPVQSCPKVNTPCPEDFPKECVVITDHYGIGHIPPYVPLTSIKNALKSKDEDPCTWFDVNTNGCNIQKSVLDRLVYKNFGKDDKIKWEPPILLKDDDDDGELRPSNTYYRLEYIDQGTACDDSNCRGGHYCSVEAAKADIWGDFCPYVHTGKNAGLYRHPHLAFAALELWIVSQCNVGCPSEWLESPNAVGYGKDLATSTSITWSEMMDNDDPISQPKVPYEWPNSGKGLFPGFELYDDMPYRMATGSYVTEYLFNSDNSGKSLKNSKSPKASKSSKTGKSSK
jgi:hypothetical protein